MTGHWARLARETVTQAVKVSLAIRGLPPGLDRSIMGFYTDNGWPVMRCELTSALAAAAEDRRAAVLTVDGPADAAVTVTVRLTGRLEMIGHARENGHQVSAVMLDLDHVVIETREPGWPAMTRPVPVAEYTATDPAVLAACARHLAEHTNDSHGGELRRFAAARADVPDSDLAAAWLDGLDASGTRLSWIGLDGGNSTEVRFPRRARTLTELSLLLRQQLGSGNVRGDRRLSPRGRADPRERRLPVVLRVGHHDLREWIPAVQAGRDWLPGLVQPGHGVPAPQAAAASPGTVLHEGDVP